MMRSIKPVLLRLPWKWEWLAAFDYFLRPSFREELGGPFNGQHFRKQIFLELLRTLQFRAIVETGTNRGCTTEFLAKESQVPVYTAECMPRFFHYANFRLRHQTRVHVVLDDSRRFIKRLAQDSSFPKLNVFFYLDAHWYGDLPSRDEVELICRSWKEAVIMIDDFEVPGDPGYRYDDYGPGKRLRMEYLDALSQFELVTFFPSVSSESESGAKRGCVVLTDRAVAERLGHMQLLRRHDSPDC